MASIHQFPTGKKKPKLFEFPLIRAKSPLDSGEDILLQVSQNTVDKLVEAMRRTELFGAWAHLVGEMPPVNNAELVRRTEFPDASFGKMEDAQACFQGVKRRYDQDDNGAEIFVYVIETTHTVRWQSSMKTVAGIVEVPNQSVLTVQVRSSETLQCADAKVWGTITKWEFVNGSTEQTTFPDGFNDRYDSLLWQR